MPSVFDAGPNDHKSLLVAKAIFGIALALAAPFVASVTIQTFVKASQSNAWPQAEATVTRSEVITDVPLGGRGPEFTPKIEYRFTAQGKPYDGNRIAFRGTASRTKAVADAIAGKYALGTQHPVHYNPANPADSVLERGTHWLTYAGLVIPVVMLVCGIMMAKVQIDELRRRSANPERKTGSSS